MLVHVCPRCPVGRYATDTLPTLMERTKSVLCLICHTCLRQRGITSRNNAQGVKFRNYLKHDRSHLGIHVNSAGFRCVPVVSVYLDITLRK